MPPTSTELRKDLAALRLDRTEAEAPSRRWIGFAVALALLLGIGLTLRLRGQRAVTVETARPTIIEGHGGGAAYVPILSGSGYVVSAERYVALGVKVPGRIERYFVEEGDRVTKGDPLVEIDPREYRATVARIEATVAQAQATATLKEKQLARARTLARQGIISRDELDVRVADFAAATATTQQARAELTQAQVALEYTVLRAPTAGVILAKLKEVGEIAVPGGFSGSGDLLRLANLTDLRGQVDITEGEIAKIRLQQRADVQPDAYPDKRYRAKVIKLYPQVDRQKGTLRVEVQVEQPDEFLWPDMSARITFFEPAVAAANRAVLVPKGAIRRQGETASVWVVRGGTATNVPVTLGGDFGEQVQTTNGLDGTESLIVGDVTALTEGQAVTTAAAPTP
jgi:RND family efflux transporter MFP subunit